MNGFSRRHPDLVIRIHDSMLLDERRVLVEVEMEGASPNWSKELEGFSDVSLVEQIDIPHRTPRYRVLSRRLACFRPFHDLAVLPSDPRTFQNGFYHCETIAPASQLRRLVASLKRVGARPRLTSIRPLQSPVPRPRPRGLLTPVQQRFFTEALERGYYEVPRRITLSRLAERLGRSKSSVSHALALVERKLAMGAVDLPT